MVFIGGADASGNNSEGQLNHIALIVGTEEAINTAYKNLEVERKIHMNQITAGKRERIRRRLDLGSGEICALCMHVERQGVENHILNHEKTRRHRNLKSSIHKNFDTHLRRLVRSELDPFLRRHRLDLSDITVQVDGDMRHSVRYWKMKSAGVGRAHEMADAIAWFNQKRMDVDPRCRKLDLREKIRKAMEHDMWI